MHGCVNMMSHNHKLILIHKSYCVCVFQGVQRRMFLSGQFFSIFEMIIVCFVVDMSDLMSARCGCYT